MKPSTLLVVTFVILLIFHKGTGNQKKLVVRQPLFINATVGESVTIPCLFETESPSFTVKWTLCCNQLKPLQVHQSYKDRIILSPTFQEVTIVNVTEQDSEKFCCEVLTADGEAGVGNGTLLKVAPYVKEKECSNENMCIVIEIIRLAFLTIIIILLSVIIKKLP